jgi:hypothetical protein
MRNLNLRSKFRKFIENFFLGGIIWGFIRLLIVLMILITLVFIGWLGFEQEGSSSGIFRYLFLPLATLFGAIFFAARYVQDTYQLPRFGLALHYIIAALFAFDYPSLIASEGHFQVKEDKINLMLVIGGPGILQVKPGNVVLLETIRGPGRIFGAGDHYVNQLERVKEVVGLEDQHGLVEEINARTKDGIPVRVLGVNFRYRLQAGENQGEYPERTPQAPYPYSEVAVRNMAYRRAVSINGSIIPWHIAVTRAIEGAIAEYISTHQLDRLTSPNFLEKDSRSEILERINSERTREALRTLGAELLWVGIGHFDIDEKVKERRLDTWGAKWVGNAKVIKSYGEAQRIIYQEIGRAEGQAELLMSIIHALDQVSQAGDSTEDYIEKVRRIILLRTAQILDAITEREKPPEKRQLPSPETKAKKIPRVKNR